VWTGVEGELGLNAAPPGRSTGSVAFIRTLTTGMLPLLAEAAPRRRRAASAAAAVLVTWMAAHLASATLGIGERNHLVDVVVNLPGPHDGGQRLRHLPAGGRLDRRRARRDRVPPRPPDRVVLEITEDVMLTDPERSLTALARLSAAGVHRLTGFGVDIAQGYHIARPMPAADVEAWLAAGGFHQEDVEGPRPVDAFDAIQLDVRSRARA
jgi:hypothetical protein